MSEERIEIVIHHSPDPDLAKRCINELSDLWRDAEERVDDWIDDGVVPKETEHYRELLCNAQLSVREMATLSDRQKEMITTIGKGYRERFDQAKIKNNQKELDQAIGAMRALSDLLNKL